MDQNIANRPVGTFFRNLDLNSHILVSSCIAFGTWFNQHYADPTVFKNMDVKEIDTYFDSITKGFVSGGFSLVRNWKEAGTALGLTENTSDESNVAPARRFG